MLPNSVLKEAPMDNDLLSSQSLPTQDREAQSPARLDVDDDDPPANHGIFLEDVVTVHSSVHDPAIGMGPDPVASQQSQLVTTYSCPATDGEGGESRDWFDEDTEFFHQGNDGIADRMWRTSSQPVAAIFIHAGAGYHSTHNEHVHLAACSDAAEVAMLLLREGGSAVDAVEAAIKSLEDKEITNAGYGSNLSLEGKVECDATLVDQYGRSGACGATPNVKNPICLARLILDASNETLSLRRVPPNLLIGEGAKNFAFEHNMQLFPDELLISANSRERYDRWVEDLQRADAARIQYEEAEMAAMAVPEEQQACHNNFMPHGRDHVAALNNATWNEGQPDSPQPDSPEQQLTGSSLNPSLAEIPFSQAMQDSTSVGPNGLTIPALHNPLAFVAPTQSPREGVSRGTKRRIAPLEGNTGIASFSPPGGSPNKPPAAKKKTSRDTNTILGVDGASSDPRPSYSRRPKAYPARPATASLDSQDACTDDAICDTVGAIAIDLYGAIAAGSSSGGIGMKHSGRVGPAALVGIGSAVVPADPSDVHGTAVAAVTSGTGEHMATTMASYKCAERLYHCTRRSSTGGDVKDRNEDAVLDSFVKKDFMDHPGVKNQPSQAAIGVMAVKQTRNGYYFYFAHNTDSFALCSMTSNEKSPHCVMSRIGEDRSVVARGGRRIRVD